MTVRVLIAAVGLLCLAATPDSFTKPVEITQCVVFPHKSDSVLPVKDIDRFLIDLHTIETIPGSISHDGGEIKAIPVNFSGGLLNLEPYFLPYGKRFKKYLAIVFLEVYSEQDQSVLLGTAADWYMQWYVNGKKLYSTMPTQTSFGGNGTTEYSPGNHILSIPLKKGRNILAAKVVSGDLGFKLIASFGDDVQKAKEQAENLERRKVEQLRSPASVQIDFAKHESNFVRSEKYNAWASYPIQTSQEQLDLYRRTVGRQNIVRVWLHPVHYYDEKEDTFTFPTERDEYLKRAASIADSVMIGAATVNDRKRIIEPMGRDSYVDVLARGLKHYKQRYPNLEWIEGPNEPEVHGIRDPKILYRDYYNPLMQAVSRVNRELKPQRPLKVGGPVNCTFIPAFLEGFLEAYANDDSPDRQLAFISYHQYLSTINEEPIKVRDERESLETMLDNVGLPADMPVMITETGIFPGFAGSSDRQRDRYTQATGMLTLHYQYQASSRYTFPFQWVNIHPDNDRKDQFRRDRLGLTPYGMANQAKAMLRDTRVTAVAQPQTDGGLGLYALASYDETGVSILIWNYQFVRYNRGQRFSDIEIELLNLPTHLRDRHGTLRTYEVAYQGADNNEHGDTLTPVKTATKRLNKGVWDWLDLDLNGFTLLHFELD